MATVAKNTKGDNDLVEYIKNDHEKVLNSINKKKKFFFFANYEIDQRASTLYFANAALPFVSAFLCSRAELKTVGHPVLSPQSLCPKLYASFFHPKIVKQQGPHSRYVVQLS